MMSSDSDPDPRSPQEPKTFREAFAQAARGSGIGQVAPGEIPTARSLLRAVGGVRGLGEAILPGLSFLILYSTTRNLPLSVIAPVVIALVFVVIRFVGRTAATQALVGIVGVAVSAGLALFTGRAEDNFVVGIWINIISLVVIVASLIARYPVIGLFVGILANEGLDWRADARKRRVLTLATVLWLGLFATRLIIEVPLYLTGEVEILGAAKLILGVPFYAAVLWITWVMVRSVYASSGSVPSPSDT